MVKKAVHNWRKIRIRKKVCSWCEKKSPSVEPLNSFSALSDRIFRTAVGWKPHCRELVQYCCSRYTDICIYTDVLDYININTLIHRYADIFDSTNMNTLHFVDAVSNLQEIGHISKILQWIVSVCVVRQWQCAEHLQLIFFWHQEHSSKI